jgi:hypothetical protein
MHCKHESSDKYTNKKRKTDRKKVSNKLKAAFQKHFFINRHSTSHANVDRKIENALWHTILKSFDFLPTVLHISVVHCCALDLYIRFSNKTQFKYRNYTINSFRKLIGVKQGSPLTFFAFSISNYTDNSYNINKTTIRK